MVRRIGRFIREFFGVASTGSEAMDAEAVRTAQKHVLEEQLAQYNQSLAASASFCDLLRQQIGKLQGQEETLQAVLRSRGQPGGSEQETGELALRLHRLGGELADLREQLKQAEAGCQQIAAAREVAIAAARKKMAGSREV
ncbi:MAG TPA: hypothetical protein VNT26_22665 [Candidatus Sulfotelmatobacter sp.]|nr:hypothetical protein [Candidatus Sulfotelmatobacter sp.]